MNEINANSFVVKIDTELSKSIETAEYEVTQHCKNIVFLLNKNVAFSNSIVKEEFDELLSCVTKYEALKNEVSDNIVIPESIKRFGENHDISWNLDYPTREVIIVDNGESTSNIDRSAFSVPQDINDRMKELSINELAYDEIYAYAASSYPSMNTDAYKKFKTLRTDTSRKFSDMKRDLANDFARPYMKEKGFDGMFKWKLNFDTTKVDIFY